MKKGSQINGQQHLNRAVGMAKFFELQFISSLFLISSLMLGVSSCQKVTSWFGIKSNSGMNSASTKPEDFSKKRKVDDIAVVEKRDLEQRVNFSGRVVPKKTLTIYAPFKGYVQNLFVNIGDSVQVGTPLVSMSQTPTQQGIQGEVFPIRSSLRGTVVQVQKQVGEYVGDISGNDPSTMLLRVDDMSELFIEAEIVEMDYPKLKLGQEVVIKPSSLQGQSYQGKIFRLAKAAKSQDRWDRYRVEYESETKILNPDEKLVSGMTATIDVITAKLEGVLTLPVTHVQRDNKEGYFVMRENGSKQLIEVGLQTDEFFEIVKGLQSGDKVRIAEYLNR